MTLYQCMECEHVFSTDIDKPVCPNCKSKMVVRVDFSKVPQKVAEDLVQVWIEHGGDGQWDVKGTDGNKYLVKIEKK